MASLFCCSSIEPYKGANLSHQSKFITFMDWAAYPKTSSVETSGDGKTLQDSTPSYAVQLVQQVNYGHLESKRYFMYTGGQDEPFIEVTEEDLIQANFQKLNS
jgi:hypothetical protein